MKTENKFNLDYEKIGKQFLLFLTIIGFLISIYYSVLNIETPKFVNIVLILPFIFFLAPYLILSLYSVKKIESKMQVIPRFLRDVVDNVDSGMDLITSIKNTIGNEYIVLNEDITKFVNQLSWGINFEIAFLNFADNVGSKSLKRDLILIIEARKVGGHFEKILRELSEKINTENLRNKERKTNLASTTFTGYISFLIFIFIIVLVYNNLFLGIGESIVAASSTQSSNVQVDNSQLSIFLSLLIFLSYELAILSGFLFGLMQENNIITGAPHVVMLVILTFIGFFFFIHF